MKLNQAKEYYDFDVLTGFDAVSDPITGGWLLVVHGKNDKSWTIQTALGQDKVYSNFDSVNSEINRITGFKPPVWSFKI